MSEQENVSFIKPRTYLVWLQNG